MTNTINILSNVGTLLYRPELRKITGSVNSAILLNQAIFRWVTNGSKEFYKFKEPCSHELYHNGDSWCEELGFSREEFDTALAKIGFKKGTPPKNQVPQSPEEALIIYYTDDLRLTRYSVNPALLEKLLNPLYLNVSETTTENTFINTGKVEITQEPVVESTPIGLPKTTQTFKKDRKIKQAFRQNSFVQQAPRSFRGPQPEKTLEQSLTDNLATEEDIKALAKELKVTPEQVKIKKDAYLDFINEKKVPGQNMKYLVKKWIRDDLYTNKIEPYMNAAERHNKEMMELVNAVENGTFEI